MHQMDPLQATLPVLSLILKCTRYLKGLTVNNVDRCSELQSAIGVQYSGDEAGSFMLFRPSSCAGIKRLSVSARIDDGEYKLQFGDQLANVYCHKMNSSNPLVSNSNGNRNFRSLYTCYILRYSVFH